MFETLLFSQICKCSITNTNGTAVTVFAGETATLPAETMSTGTLSNYTTTLSCDNGVTPSGTNGQSTNSITILEGLPTFLGAVDEQIAKEANA